MTADKLKAEIEAGVARNYRAIFERKFGRPPRLTDAQIIAAWHACYAMDDQDNEVLAEMTTMEDN